MVSTGSTLHGGPDALGTPAHDFSTNVNAVGPCPAVLAALQQQVPDTYPDPAYTDLRARLASWHGVHPDQIVIGTSGSELISRLTAAFFRASLEWPGAMFSPGSSDEMFSSSCQSQSQ
ncbi:MAG: hypothetical protein Q4D91_15380, partial [Lautropia sp.]|nr:hypothetical protein [Lautropia sp.]